MSEVVTEKSWAITPVGVGRKDYSQNVELAVESQIRSYQDEYKHYQTMDIAAGNFVQKEIDITAKTVVMLYDFYLSGVKNLLLHLKVEALMADGVTWAVIGRKSAYQAVEIHYSRGFPLFDKYRITAYNHGGEDVTCNFSAHGIVTSEEEYYGEYFG